MPTLLFRNAQLSDLDAIHQLAINSGIGITTLPQNIDILSGRLKLSVASIQTAVDHPNLEYYLFVLENPKTQQIVGTSAIQASLGHDLPFYTYKLSNRTRISHALKIRHDHPLLNLVNDHQGKSEVCTLYLKPDFRNEHHGVLLSRARFLFMSQFPSRFESEVIAEMRGVADDKGHSPFWDNVGQHFFKMTFQRADELTLSTNKQFISDLISEHPIDIQLLHPEAQAVIGKPHSTTEPAMHLLFKEGFYYSNYVDIFDAGPILEATCADIHTIKTCQLATVVNIVDNMNQAPYIVSNTQLNFRATVGAIAIEPNGVTIHQETAELLQVGLGDVVRFAALNIHYNNKNGATRSCQ